MSDGSVTATFAIVPAVFAAEAADQALVDLGGDTAIERVVRTCVAAGVSQVLVLRRTDAAPLPAGLEVEVVAMSDTSELSDSLRMALLKLPRAADVVLVFPVGHALVEVDTVLALCARLQRGDCAIAVPSFRGDHGNPVAMKRSVFKELDRGATTLPDVVRRDPDRVADVATSNHWVLLELHRPEDLRAARCQLTGQSWSTLAQMYRHRSHRAFRSDPISDTQIERLVDAARHASTSSFIQAYAVIAVRDVELKQLCASLCGDQRHIEEAPVFFAVCADLNKIARACADHGTAVRSDSFELFLQTTVDASLLGQNLQLACEAEGLGACMIGGARNQPIELAQALQLPAHSFVVFGMAVGIPAEDPAARGRMPLPGVLHWNRYDSSDIADVLRSADDGMRDWAKRCNAEQGGYNGRPVDEAKGWAERMARMWGGESAYAKAREVLQDELRTLGFEV